MPVFVHLTSEKNIPSILRNGIRFEKINGFRRDSIYAMPVTRNFYVSHQWLRELKKYGQRTYVAVYFRLPDDEPVELGHYCGRRFQMTAAEATGVLMQIENNDPASSRERDENSKAIARGRAMPSSPEGYEVTIGRPIGAKEILRIKAVPQVLGWRHRPGAHGNAPSVCLCCERGTYGISKMRKRVEEDERKGKKTKIIMFGRE